MTAAPVVARGEAVGRHPSRPGSVTAMGIVIGWL
jgi:hypothetical protein